MNRRYIFSSTVYARIRRNQPRGTIDYVVAVDGDPRILCGCPADSVKHLMRAGLIVSVELDRIERETGPNAILLSDLIPQNRRVSNRSEFPVLQMLHKQESRFPATRTTARREIARGAPHFCGPELSHR